MTSQLVDHAHTDSCIVIGCNLVQLRRKMNMFICIVAVTLHYSCSHSCEHEVARCCMSLHNCHSLITVIIVNNALVLVYCC